MMRNNTPTSFEIEGRPHRYHPRRLQHTTAMHGILDIDFIARPPVFDRRPLDQRTPEEIMSVFREPDRHGYAALTLADNTRDSYRGYIELLLKFGYPPTPLGLSLYIDINGAGLTVGQVKGARAALGHVEKVLGATPDAPAWTHLITTQRGHAAMLRRAIRNGDAPVGKPVGGFSPTTFQKLLNYMNAHGASDLEQSAAIVCFTGGLRADEIDQMRYEHMKVRRGPDNSITSVTYTNYRHKEAASKELTIATHNFYLGNGYGKILAGYFEVNRKGPIFPAGTAAQLKTTLGLYVCPIMIENRILDGRLRWGSHSLRTGAAQLAYTLCKGDESEKLDAVRERTAHAEGSLEAWRYSRSNEERLADHEVAEEEYLNEMTNFLDDPEFEEDTQYDANASSSAAAASPKRKKRQYKKKSSSKAITAQAGQRRGRAAEDVLPPPPPPRTTQTKTVRKRNPQPHSGGDPRSKKVLAPRRGKGKTQSPGTGS